MTEIYKALWYSFYLIFNDYNLRHCKTAYFNNHLYDDESLISSLHNWKTEIKSRGISIEPEYQNIINLMKEILGRDLENKEKDIVHNIIKDDKEINL